MADQRHWDGTLDDGDYGQAANWRETAVPVATDEVFIEGSKSIVTGLDQTAVNIGDFVVQPDFTGNIGSPSGYLQLDLQNSDLLYRGQGKAYIDCGDNANDTPDKVTVNTSSATGALYVKLEVANPLAEMYNLRGTTYLEAGNVTIAYLSYISNLKGDATLVFNDGTLTALRQIGGYFAQNPRTTSEPGAGTPDTVAHYMHGGTALIQDGDYQACEMFGGSIVYSVSVADGVLDTLTVWGGLFDATKDERDKTITTAKQYGIGRIVTGDHVTLTNDIYTLGTELASFGQDVIVARV